MIDTPTTLLVERLSEHRFCVEPKWIYTSEYYHRSYNIWVILSVLKVSYIYMLGTDKMFLKL